MSSRVREVVHQSASVCAFEGVEMLVDLHSDGGDLWDVVTDVDDVAEDGDGIARVSGVASAPGTTIRVAPMDRKCGGWDFEHFHEDLRCPDTAASFVLSFQATGRECVAVALSPTPCFAMGKTYAVHLGAGGNLTTVLRRWLPSGGECVESTSSTVRICTDNEYRGYWVVFHQGRLYVGTGAVPGRQCVAMLDDSLYDQLRPGQDRVRYVGIGNSSLHRYARDIKVRNVKLTSFPMDAAHLEMLSNMKPTPVNFSGGGRSGRNGNGNVSTVDSSNEELLKQYHEECAKANLRAIKYGADSATDGITSEPPNPDNFLKWSEARRLRANPEPGFITGIDVTSQEEKTRRQKRKERFEREERKRRMAQGEEMEDADDVAASNHQNEDKDDTTMDEGRQPQSEEVLLDEDGNLPVEQAWDNIEWISEYRVDPSSSNLAADNDTTQEEKIVDDSNTYETAAEPVPEKVHIFAIDWAAFKQLRTDDIMAYFSDFGPSYVEWLGELSCNVMFQDKFSAIRAMDALSQQIPTPPPSTMENGTMIVSGNGDSNNSNDEITSADNNNSAMNNSNDDETNNNTDTTTQNNNNSFDDLGALGWRFCLAPLVKVANDRYGRRGTRSRLLMRVALSSDVLLHRPTEAPAPPPGYTTKRVLGPGSDFPPRRKKKGKRGGDNNRHNQQQSKRRRRNNDMDEDMSGEDGIKTTLNQGLKSKRAGFTVEEMEKERAMKKSGLENQ